MASSPLGLRAIHTGRFRFRTPPLVLARLRLYPDRLELTGWHLHGRYRRTVMLGHLLQADAQGDDRLLLWLADGEVLRLNVERASHWRAAIELEQRQMGGRDT